MKEVAQLGVDPSSLVAVIDFRQRRQAMVKVLRHGMRRLHVSIVYHVFIHPIPRSGRNQGVVLCLMAGAWPFPRCEKRLSTLSSFQMMSVAASSPDG